MSDDEEKTLRELCAPVSGTRLPRRAMLNSSGWEMTPRKARAAARAAAKMKRKKKRRAKDDS